MIFYSADDILLTIACVNEVGLNFLGSFYRM